MTAMEIIDELDAQEPNIFETEQKLRWLSTLDGQIYDELVKTHHGRVFASFPYESGDEELLVPFPYGEDIYINYLLAKLHSATGETKRYVNAMQLYNQAYLNYAHEYNRTHMPRKAGRRFRF